ncbi:MAG: tetratricopeptide repeat protein, partial [Acidobacteria bacterium]|nr:tetratricopeptide repeat protein [Acidobacteriota bacterium]
MSAAADLSALSVAAAQAASAGDTAGAIDLLRQLLALQSQHLGADHADRATTLNNLALLLERQGSVDEAGACYREAYEIARRALGPDDPMVQISRANLVAFLDGQGITAHDDLLGP